MPHEIDGDRAIYARKPAWHGIGHVKQDGWFSSAEALAVLNPDKEPIRRGRAFIEVIGTDGVPVMVEDENTRGIVRMNPDTKQWQPLSFMSKDYGVVQIEEQFEFLDDVVAEFRKHDDTAGAYYETAGLLRNGKQVFVVIDLGALNLDPLGRNDKVERYLFGSNSYDGSWAFRVKKTNIRVECANMAASALRGSSDKIVSGDWSTRHTKDVLKRVEVAKSVLGMSAMYDVEFAAESELMIQTPLHDDSFTRILEGLYEKVNTETQAKELDREAVADVRTLYELSPTCESIHGTVWGGLQAVIEHADWNAKVRGGKKSSMTEARLRRQMGETDRGFKLDAWSQFFEHAKDTRPKVVSLSGRS